MAGKARPTDLLLVNRARVDYQTEAKNLFTPVCEHEELPSPPVIDNPPVISSATGLTGDKILVSPHGTSSNGTLTRWCWLKDGEVVLSSNGESYKDEYTPSEAGTYKFKEIYRNNHGIVDVDSNEVVVEEMNCRVESSTPAEQASQVEVGFHNKYSVNSCQYDPVTGGYVSVEADDTSTYYLATYDASGNRIGRREVPGSGEYNGRIQLLHLDSVNRKAFAIARNHKACWFDLSNFNSPRVEHQASVAGLKDGVDLFHRPVCNIATDNSSMFLVCAQENSDSAEHSMLQFDTVSHSYRLLKNVGGGQAKKLGRNGGFRINGNNMLLLADGNKLFRVDAANSSDISLIHEGFVDDMTYCDELKTIFISHREDGNARITELDLDGNISKGQQVIGDAVDNACVQITTRDGFVFVNSAGQRCLAFSGQTQQYRAKLFVYNPDEKEWNLAEQSPWYSDDLQNNMNCTVGVSYGRNTLMTPNERGKLRKTTFPG